MILETNGATKLSFSNYKSSIIVKSKSNWKLNRNCSKILNWNIIIKIMINFLFSYHNANVIVLVE